MGKALHPTVCGCGSSSFTKEKAGKPWYCETCELGFCTKCGQWPLLLGDPKLCGVCVATTKDPDCTGSFVHDGITNVARLEHHGDTCPVHENDSDEAVVIMAAPVHVPGSSIPLQNAVSQAAECVDCGHIGHQVQTVYDSLVVHHEDADLEDDHDFLLPVGFCPACAMPNMDDDSNHLCASCWADDIRKCDDCGSYYCQLNPCIHCLELANVEEKIAGEQLPKCETCKGKILADVPVAHWACSKSWQKETCLCGAFDFQQPNDTKAITCGNCGLTYCAQGCTAMIINTGKDHCDLHVGLIHEDESASEVTHCAGDEEQALHIIKHAWYPDGECVQCHNGPAESTCTVCDEPIVFLNAMWNHTAPPFQYDHEACSTDVYFDCATCGDDAATINGLTLHLDILSKDYDHDATNKAKLTMYDKLKAEMTKDFGPNVVSHEVVDATWGTFVFRLSATKENIYVDYITGDQHITLMAAHKNGTIIVHNPVSETYDNISTVPGKTTASKIRYNWVFKRFGIPFRVSYKNSLWILRHANTSQLDEARVFQNAKGTPVLLALVPGS